MNGGKEERNIRNHFSRFSPSNHHLTYHIESPLNPLSKDLLETIRTGQNSLPEDHNLFVNSVFDENLEVFTDSSSKILVPPSLKNHILHMIHGYADAGHPTLSESSRLLAQSSFSWPNDQEDLALHVKHCITCQKCSRRHKPNSPSTGKLLSYAPFESVHVDTIEMSKVDIFGAKYIVHIVDAFTKYSVLVPVKSIKADDIALSLFSHVFCYFGTPKNIHSDNGTEYSNSLLNELCSLLSVQRSTSIPNYHHSNGLVEKQNSVILRALKKLLMDTNDYSRWAEYIPQIQLLVNSHPGSRTSYSPFQLLFGFQNETRMSPLSISHNLSLQGNSSLTKFNSNLCKRSLELTGSI
ncbi:hypothetical protein GEMRC1_002454 [Eukaryota sp. GEM-RC1]